MHIMCSFNNIVRFRKTILLLIFAIVLFHMMSSTTALKCYIGQQNASIPVYGEPQLCQPGALTCLKTYDPNFNMAHRQCGMANCTVDNMSSTVAVCVNSTTIPSITYCCCYGEGCNSAPGCSFVWIYLSIFAILGIASKHIIF